MKQTINLSDFRDAFQKIRPNNFSYEGLEVLFNYLEELEKDSGEELELDVIALCCDYTESSVEDALESYNLDTLEDLENETLVFKIDDETIIYQDF